MGWIYHTNINDENIDNTFNEALDKFTKQCQINKDRLTIELTTSKCYRFIIKTDDDNNKIICDDGKYFLKSKFLSNKLFKKNLINYYKPLGIYVNGPKELCRRKDGISTNNWIIELTKKI